VEPESWRDLSGVVAGYRCPLRMREAWLRGERPGCARCWTPVEVGELFTTTAYCPMGGDVALNQTAGAYADLLEVRAEHVRCLPSLRPEPYPCLTIGHGTRPIEEFIAMLRERDVRVLADIRTVPKSRHNPQFGTDALAQSLPEAGICYLHLPELGGLRKPRPDSPNAGWRNESFRGYADYMQTPVFAAALAELIALLRYARTAIMCAETLYWRCHRALVADSLLARGIPSVHLMGVGKETPHRLTRFARVEGAQVLYPAELAALPLD
jgi:hypothetical protein